MQVMKRRWMALWTICCVLTATLFCGKMVYASSAALAFSKNKENITVGQTFVVTLTVESATEFKDFQTYAAYDPKVLELIDTGNHVTGSEGLIFISDIDGKKSNIHQYRMKFRALQEGSSQIYISDTVYIYEADTASEMSVSKGTLEINVGKEEVIQEKNQGLGSLSVGEGELTPAFGSDVTEYHVNVSEDTETLFIDAKAKLKACHVTIEGNTNLKEGDNTAKIIVTDKNETQKIYTIYIHKKSKEEQVLEQEEQETGADEEQEQRLTVNVEDEGVILNTNLYFRIVPVPDSSIIPKGYKEENIKLHKETITVYMPLEDEAGNFVLIYGKAEGDRSDEAGFYTFDRMEETLQRYREEEKVVEPEEDNTNYQKQIRYLYIMIFILVMCLLAMLLALLHVYVKLGKQLELDEHEEEDKDDEWL